jgi:hypothetical protein
VVEVPLPNGGVQALKFSPDSTNRHALVFALGRYVIGVRGSRLTGVTLDELTKVAASIK